MNLDRTHRAGKTRFKGKRTSPPARLRRMKYVSRRGKPGCPTGRATVSISTGEPQAVAGKRGFKQDDLIKGEDR